MPFQAHIREPASTIDMKFYFVRRALISPKKMNFKVKKEMFLEIDSTDSQLTEPADKLNFSFCVPTALEIYFRSATR